MILTGPEIERERAEGNLSIDPLGEGCVQPNSVDLRLHEDLLVYGESQFPFGGRVMRSKDVPGWVSTTDEYDEYLITHGHCPPDGGAPPAPITLDMHEENPTVPLRIPKEGFVLYPGTLYLGRTIEAVGSDKYVMHVAGRSSIGRLGIQVHVTAGFVDQGFHGTLTLEITVIHPVRIYPGVRFCQLSFTTVVGESRLYDGRYQGQTDPVGSRFFKG